MEEGREMDRFSTICYASDGAELILEFAASKSADELSVG